MQKQKDKVEIARRRRQKYVVQRQRDKQVVKQVQFGFRSDIQAVFVT